MNKAANYPDVALKIFVFLGWTYFLTISNIDVIWIMSLSLWYIEMLTWMYPWFAETYANILFWLWWLFFAVNSPKEKTDATYVTF